MDNKEITQSQQIQANPPTPQLTGSIVSKEQWHGKSSRLYIANPNKKEDTLFNVRVKTELNRFDRATELILSKFQKHKWVKVQITDQEVKRDVYLNVNSFAKVSFRKAEEIRKEQEASQLVQKTVNEFEGDVATAKFIQQSRPESTQKFKHFVRTARAVKQASRTFPEIKGESGYQLTSVPFSGEAGKRGEVAIVSIWRGGETYIHGGIIDQGASKIVQKGFDIFRGEEVALAKSSFLGDKSMTVAAEREEENHETFKGSEHIAQLQKVGWIKEYSGGILNYAEQIMVMKFYNGSALKNHVRTLRPPQKNKVSLDILKGMRNIHNKRKIHNDLKAGNIFLSFDPTDGNKVSAYVADLGAMTSVDSEMPFAGTPICMAPNHWLEAYLKFPMNQEQRFQNETFETGLLLFETHYPEETLPWVKALENLSNELQVEFQKNGGTLSQEQILKITGEIAKIQDQIQTFVKEEKEKLTDNQDLVRKTILDLMDFGNQTTIDDAITFFEGPNIPKS